jgi:6-phosphogluconolactonase
VLLAEQAGRGGSIVLTGGTTPAAAYRLAAETAPDWSAVDLWWGDERCVPPEDERSNYRLAKENLLERLEQAPREVHRIRGELQPADAAGELDVALDGVDLDVLLLGLGPDGHIASLFPKSPQLEIEDRRATSGPAGLEPWVDRVTMTLPTLLAAKRIVVLVSGAGKADAVAAAFAGPVSREVPGSLLRQARVPVEVYADRAAAARIDP